MVTKPVTDWESVEREYRAGIRSGRDIGAEFGCSHTAIQKKADKEGWTRDLAAKIRAKANEKVAKEQVAKSVAMETSVTEQAIIEANATMQADIILAHRSDIRRNRELAKALLVELEGQTGNLELFAQLGTLLNAPDEKGIDKLNDLYRKVISLPSRVDSMKKLAETLKTLIGLEREAFGIDSRGSVGETIESLLEKLDG